MKKASKFLIPSIVFLVLLLDLLALDDITTGKQPNNWGEWDFFLFSFVGFGLIIYSNWESLQKWITKKL